MGGGHPDTSDRQAVRYPPLACVSHRRWHPSGGSMTLLSEAQALATRSGSTCGVALLVRRLDDVERAELEEAIASDVSAAAIAKALELRGYSLYYQSINRHRR